MKRILEIKGQSRPVFPDSLERPKVFLVGPKSKDLLSIEKLMKSMDIDVYHANSHEKALEDMSSQLFGLILYDVQKNGDLAASFLQEKRVPRHIPLLFLINPDQDKNFISENYVGRHVDHVLKPIEPETLKNKVRFFLQFFQLEKRLQASEDHLREIIQSSALGMIVVDQDRMIQFTNSSAEFLFGKKSSEIVGTFFGYAVTSQQKMEITLSGKENSRKTAEIWVSDIVWNAKPCWLVSMRDITERKEIERELEKARDSALEVARFKSEFLANMSHEIRTPLNAIIGMAVLLGETSLTSEQKKYVNVFQKAGSSLLEIINEILDFSKLESGETVLEEIKFSCRETVQGVVDLLLKRAEEKKLLLQAKVQDDVPDLLLGDAHHLRQILINLIGNALKFTDEGTVLLDVKKDRDEPEKGICWITFSVKDAGVGIPKSKLSQIFGSFHQADSSITRKFGGTGLGLSISKKLVNQMDSELKVESNEGEGSRFYFTVPLKVLEESSPPQNKENFKADKDFVSSSLKLLLVDDSEDNRFLVSSYLSKTLHSIEIAENGEIAVNMVKKNDYDLVFMDMQMPVMDGCTAVKIIRQWEKDQVRAPVPIVALTAYALKEEVQKSFDIGCVGHLTKPLLKEDLLKVIAKYGHHPQEIRENPREKVIHGKKIIVQIDSEIKPLIPRYLKNRQKDLKIMKEALAKKEFETISALGHNTKGVGASFGFERLSYLGNLLEKAAKNKNDNEIKNVLKEIEIYLNDVEIFYD